MVRNQLRPVTETAPDILTDREKEVLRRFASGLSYAQIADARYIRTVSVRNAICRIQEKLCVESKIDHPPGLHRLRDLRAEQGRHPPPQLHRPAGLSPPALHRRGNRRCTDGPTTQGNLKSALSKPPSCWLSANHAEVPVHQRVPLATIHRNLRNRRRKAKHRSRKVSPLGNVVEREDAEPQVKPVAIRPRPRRRISVNKQMQQPLLPNPPESQ